MTNGFATWGPLGSVGDGADDDRRATDRDAQLAAGRGDGVAAGAAQLNAGGARRVVVVPAAALGVAAAGLGDVHERREPTVGVRVHDVDGVEGDAPAGRRRRNPERAG